MGRMRRKNGPPGFWADTKQTWKRLLVGWLRPRSDPTPGDHAEIVARRIAELEAELAVIKEAIKVEARRVPRRSLIELRGYLVRARDLRCKHQLLRCVLGGDGKSANAVPEPTGKIRRDGQETRKLITRLLDQARCSGQAERICLEQAAKDLFWGGPEVQQAAAELLVYLRLPESVQLLRAALQTDNPELCGACLRGLTELAAPCARREFEDFFSSPHPGLRLAALRGLEALASPELLSACLQGLADRDAQVRRAAVTLLGREGSSEPALTILLADECVDVRIAAANALGAQPSRGGVGALIRALLDPEVRVRAASRSALQKLLELPLQIDIDDPPPAFDREVEALSSWWRDSRVEVETGKPGE